MIKQGRAAVRTEIELKLPLQSLSGEVVSIERNSN
jgi:hypothetical protein